MFGATDGGNQVRTATFGYQKQRMVNGVELHPDLQPEFKGRQIDWHIGDHLRSDIRQFTSVPCFHLLSHRLKVSLIRSTPTEMRGMGITASTTAWI
jgi:hypothetical protein